VHDLDESETTETLDAPADGVDYTIPFGLVASISLPGPDDRGARVRVVLHDGEELSLERAEYVPWADVRRIDFDRGPAGAVSPSSRR
jgi:hypothetical protein